MCQLLTEMQRPVGVINLDPDNDNMKYNSIIDIRELITLSDVSDEFNLGPNGGLLYCLQTLSNNMEWLYNKIIKLPKNCYLIFDLPGQIELYIHHKFMRDIVNILTNQWDLRLCCINLVKYLLPPFFSPFFFAFVFYVKISVFCARFFCLFFCEKKAKMDTKP